MVSTTISRWISKSNRYARLISCPHQQQRIHVNTTKHVHTQQDNTCTSPDEYSTASYCDDNLIYFQLQNRFFFFFSLILRNSLNIDTDSLEIDTGSLEFDMWEAERLKTGEKNFSGERRSHFSC